MPCPRLSSTFGTNWKGPESRAPSWNARAASNTNFGVASTRTDEVKMLSATLCVGFRYLAAGTPPKCRASRRTSLLLDQSQVLVDLCGSRMQRCRQALRHHLFCPKMAQNRLRSPQFAYMHHYRPRNCGDDPWVGRS